MTLKKLFPISLCLSFKFCHIFIICQHFFVETKGRKIMFAWCSSTKNFWSSIFRSSTSSLLLWFLLFKNLVTDLKMETLMHNTVKSAELIQQTVFMQRRHISASFDSKFSSITVDSSKIFLTLSYVFDLCLGFVCKQTKKQKDYK